MERIVTIDGQDVRMTANAATPRLYRSQFKKDVFLGMQAAVTPEGEIKDFELFENLAFIMALQAGSIPIGTKIEDWLGGFSPMAIPEATSQLIELWSDETETTSDAKKE